MEEKHSLPIHRSVQTASDFFPEERWEEFNKELRRHWQSPQSKVE